MPFFRIQAHHVKKHFHAMVLWVFYFTESMNFTDHYWKSMRLLAVLISGKLTSLEPRGPRIIQSVRISWVIGINHHRRKSLSTTLLSVNSQIIHWMSNVEILSCFTIKMLWFIFKGNFKQKMITGILRENF